MKDIGVYLENILSCIERVRRYTASGRDVFFRDEMTQDAVIRSLQVLAESCGRLPRDLRERRREIDWRGINGFRNVLVHDYLDLNLERIWAVIESELPPFAVVIREELDRSDAEIQAQGREGST